MKHYIHLDAWNIIEEEFVPHLHKISESLFSIGNGRMGQRANFEEAYSGESLQGSYVAGVYYPDKTRVGWWKNGYPEYFAKVLNATNWIGIGVKIDGEILDLNTCTVTDFRRVLNMQEGYLERSFTATLHNGQRVRIHATRFCSIVDDETGAIRYSITLLDKNGELELTPYLDGDIRNQDANYDEKFWEPIQHNISGQQAYITLETRKTAFQVTTGMAYEITQDDKMILSLLEVNTDTPKYLASTVKLTALAGQETVVYKYAANLSSENHAKSDLLLHCQAVIAESVQKGFAVMKAEQAAAWAKKWEESDIIIEGDVAAQQAIRFNIFQLNQTYTGEDARLNIGPKGFTGEKYGGSTYWDTEAYCIPFYLATADQQVARNLLIYRHRQLQKAIENGTKLGFKDGAALYPMVTMNGEECHNEWEITFEEIHRNGAIAFAIYNYIRYTGDAAYLAEYGLEVLIGIARFWSQRVTWSGDKQQYVMLGVTGPNEYENNVNNNWYTSTMATWCLEYALQSLQQVQQSDAARYTALIKGTNFQEKEVTNWQHIIDNMYYPVSGSLGIFLQQDGYLDKEQILVKDLPVADRPLNQKWSWDRILRSVYIKQADVLQGLYFLEDRYDLETIRRNFDFYEPRTVHESSLSPCVHAIIAAKLGDEQRAYEFYLRTARLDLDDYNNDTEDGLHITSMAGTWMSVVEGFAGMRVRNGQLYFAPFLPSKWSSFAFKIRFRGAILHIHIDQRQVQITNVSDHAITVFVHGAALAAAAGATVGVSQELIKA